MYGLDTRSPTISITTFTFHRKVHVTLLTLGQYWVLGYFILVPCILCILLTSSLHIGAAIRNAVVNWLHAPCLDLQDGPTRAARRKLVGPMRASKRCR